MHTDSVLIVFLIFINRYEQYFSIFIQLHCVHEVDESDKTFLVCHLVLGAWPDLYCAEFFPRLVNALYKTTSLETTLVRPSCFTWMQCWKCEYCYTCTMYVVDALNAQIKQWENYMHLCSLCSTSVCMCVTKQSMKYKTYKFIALYMNQNYNWLTNIKVSGIFKIT